MGNCCANDSQSYPKQPTKSKVPTVSIDEESSRNHINTNPKTPDDPITKNLRFETINEDDEENNNNSGSNNNNNNNDNSNENDINENSINEKHSISNESENSVQIHESPNLTTNDSVQIKNVSNGYEDHISLALDKESNENIKNNITTVEEKTIDELIEEYSNSEYTFIQHAAYSKGGTKKGKSKQNQDAHFEHIEFGPKGCLQFFGIADGHGPQGHKVSAYVVERLPELLQSNTELLLKQPDIALQKAISALAVELLEEFDEDLKKQITKKKPKYSNIPKIELNPLKDESESSEDSNKDLVMLSDPNEENNDTIDDINISINISSDVKENINENNENINNKNESDSELSENKTTTYTIKITPEEVIEKRKSYRMARRSRKFNGIVVDTSNSKKKQNEEDTKDYLSPKLKPQVSNVDFDTTFSGTTLTCGLKVGDMLYLGNLGDSRTVLGKLPTSGKKVVAMQLTKDHDPEDEEEIKRLEEHGAKVEKDEEGYVRIEMVCKDGNSSRKVSASLSRSLGDRFASNYGVISQADIVKYKLTNDDLFIVWASDGVWHMLPNQKVINIVGAKLKRQRDDPNIDLNKIVHRLVDDCSVIWKDEYYDYTDDITAIIGRLGKR